MTARRGARRTQRGRARRAIQRATAGLAVALTAAACGGDPAQPRDAEPLFHADDERFEFRIEEVGDAVGGPRQLRARLDPVGVWHLSAEYPIRLEARGEGLGLERERWTREDAAELSEQGLEFRLTFAPTGAGPAPLEGSLRFGICRADELCEAVRQPFAARIP